MGADETKEKIRGMLRQIGELESVGDSCFNLARILRRKRATKIVFTPEMDEGIRRMFTLVEEALTRMNTVLSGHKEDFGIAVSEDLERRINACRNELKRQNIENLDARKYDYDKGTVFVDLFSECEKTGDYIINVVEARLGAIRNGIRYRGIQMDTDPGRHPQRHPLPRHPDGHRRQGDQRGRRDRVLYQDRIRAPEAVPGKPRKGLFPRGAPIGRLAGRRHRDGPHRGREHHPHPQEDRSLRGLHRDASRFRVFIPGIRPIRSSSATLEERGIKRVFFRIFAKISGL